MPRAPVATNSKSASSGPGSRPNGSERDLHEHGRDLDTAQEEQRRAEERQQGEFQELGEPVHG
ncbi:hypothetical protein ABZ876_13280 [Streptomyces sp. NPDC046931]|uniref:hypothetical protein n=1 Tax=Streptomyces sp. NPDC046931 TaxID=3154806 RepID=UPI0033E80D7D